MNENIVVNERKLLNDVDKYINSYCKGYCKEAIKLLTEKTRMSVRQFYEDYTPVKYERTFDFRDNSYVPYYHNNSHGYYYAGVRMTSMNMQDYKGALAYEVAHLAYHGWHGDPTGYNGKFSPIRTASPLEMVKRYFVSSAFKNKIKSAGFKAAHSQTYGVLKFDNK